MAKRTCKNYRDGWEAFTRGEPSTAPEHLPAKSRARWYEGYYSAHVDHYIGHILRKWGLTDG